MSTAATSPSTAVKWFPLRVVKTMPASTPIRAAATAAASRWPTQPSPLLATMLFGQKGASPSTAARLRPTVQVMTSMPKIATSPSTAARWRPRALRPMSSLPTTSPSAGRHPPTSSVPKATAPITVAPSPSPRTSPTATATSSTAAPSRLQPSKARSCCPPTLPSTSPPPTSP